MNYINVPKLLLALGLPQKRPKKGSWLAKTGIKMRGDSHHGLPFGRVRAVLLYLIAKVDQTDPVVCGTIDEIIEMFELEWSQDNVEDHFQRLIWCHFGIVGTIQSCCRRHHVVNRDLDFIRAVDYCQKSRSFAVVFSESFARQVRDGSPCEFGLIRELVRAERFTLLDLALWYQWKYASGNLSSVDAFGPDGPCGLLDIPGSSKKQREELEKRHNELLEFWPDVPFRVVDNGATIELDPGRARMERPAAELTQPGRGRSDDIHSPAGVKSSNESPSATQNRASVRGASVPVALKSGAICAAQDARAAAEQFRLASRAVAMEARAVDATQSNRDSSGSGPYLTAASHPSYSPS